MQKEVVAPKASCCHEEWNIKPFPNTWMVLQLWLEEKKKDGQAITLVISHKQFGNKLGESITY